MCNHDEKSKVELKECSFVDDVGSGSEFEFIAGTESDPVDTVLSEDAPELGNGQHEEKENAEDDFENDLGQIGERFYGETFQSEINLNYDKVVSLTIKKCTFEEVANFMLYENALFELKGCVFKKSVYFDCCGGSQLNIQDCMFSADARIYIRRESLVNFNGNLVFGDFSLVISDKIDVLLKNNEFNGKSKINLCSETNLKCESNEFTMLAVFNIIGEANAIFQRNSFLMDSIIINRGDSIVLFEANECKGSHLFNCLGKFDATVERNSFLTQKMKCLDDAVVRFKSNICHEHVKFQFQGNADVNIQKCLFHGYNTLCICNSSPIKLKKNFSTVKTYFEGVNFVIERNWFKKEEKKPISVPEPQLQISESSKTPSIASDNPLSEALLENKSISTPSDASLSQNQSSTSTQTAPMQHANTSLPILQKSASISNAKLAKTIELLRSSSSPEDLATAVNMMVSAPPLDKNLMPLTSAISEWMSLNIKASSLFGKPPSDEHQHNN